MSTKECWFYKEVSYGNCYESCLLCLLNNSVQKKIVFFVLDPMVCKYSINHRYGRTKRKTMKCSK